MRVVVLGAGGLLGRALAAAPPPGVSLQCFARSGLDVRDTTALERMLHDARPHWVLNASAYTNVDGAEAGRDEAWAVNATAVGELARLCRLAGAGLAHFSTDYVFAGDREGCYAEDDPVAPVNAYGASKEAGERLVRDSGARHLIIRTQWLFGVGGKSFLSTVLDRARRGDAIRVVSDEFGQCTYADDLAAAAFALLPRAGGTFHVANRGRVSRYEVARRIYESAGMADRVTPVSTKELTMPAPRPTSSLLCVGRVENALGRRMPGWTDAVARYVASSA